MAASFLFAISAAAQRMGKSICMLAVFDGVGAMEIIKHAAPASKPQGAT